MPSQNADFRNSSNDDIDVFVRKIAPRRGRHVASLGLTFQPHVITRSRPPYPIPGFQFPLDKIIEDDHPVLETRVSLYRAALRLLPSLTSLSLDMGHIYYMNAYEGLADSLAVIGPQLRELRLTSTNIVYDPLRIADLLNQFTNLHLLHLKIRGNPRRRMVYGTLPIADTLSSFEHLEELLVDDSTLFSYPVIEEKWKAPLKRLILRQCSLPMEELLPWMRRFGGLEEVRIVNAQEWLNESELEQARAAWVEKGVKFELVEAVDDSEYGEMESTRCTLRGETFLDCSSSPSALHSSSLLCH